MRTPDRPRTPTGASSRAAPTSASSQPPGLRLMDSPDAMPAFLGKQLLLSFNPLSGNRSGLRPKLQPTMPSADFCLALSANCSALSQFLSLARSQGTRQISQGKTQNVPRVDAEFIKHAPRDNGGLHGHVPARPERATPQIRFVYLAPRFWIGLPSDPTSRRRPCPSPSLRLLLYLASGLAPD
jgi:hypothetical protein